MLTKGNFYKTDEDQTMLVVDETADGYYMCIWHEQALEDPNRGLLLFNKDGTCVESSKGHIVRLITSEEFLSIMKEIDNL